MPPLGGGSFGNLSDRYRHLYNLGGDADAQLQQTIVPVVIVDDLQRAGTPSDHLRRFHWSSNGNIGVVGASSVALKASSNVVLESCWVYPQGTAGIGIQFRQVAAAVTDPYAIATASPIFTERTQGVNDYAPVLVSATAAASADSVLGTQFFHGWSGGTLKIESLEKTAMFLQTGDKVIIRISGLCTNLTWGFSGYQY